MRGRLIHWPGVLRFLALVAIAVALVVAGMLLRYHARPPLAPVKLAAPSSPLMRELARCQNLGERAMDDPECLKAWSENRRHFFDGDANSFPHARTNKATRSGSQP